MNILFTGATGLIGQAFIKRYANQHQLYVVSRSANKVMEAFNDLVQAGRVTHVDIASLTDLNKFDAVINLAGEPIVDKRWSAKQKQRICHSRWDITQQLVDLCHASTQPPAHFLSGSAIGVYGRQSADTLINESFTKFHEEFSRDICQQWEDIASQAASESTRVCLLRTGVVLSANGGALGKMRLPFSLGLGGPVSSGQQIMSWIHIDDMVAGIAHVLDTDTIQGPVNFTAPKPVSNKTFSQSYAKSLGRPCIFTIPKLSLRVLMGESADLLLYGQKVLPDVLSASGYQFQFEDVDVAFAALAQK